MCLNISRQYHPFRAGGPLPRIASHDMLVYKALNSSISADYGLSPYTDHRWYFGVTEKATMDVVGDRYHDFEVEAGLHACVTEDRATCHAPRVVPAIIPKGAKFYYGEYGEIVADTMTVYASLDAALQGRKLGQPKPLSHRPAKA